MSNSYDGYMLPGGKFIHNRLGECQIRSFNDDGSVTVCTTYVHDGSNTFRLWRPSQGLHRWNFEVEMGV